jgi:hypothetical protein
MAITTPLDRSTTRLGRLDRLTLGPGGDAVDLGEYHEAWAFSPDGQTLAVGTFVRTGVRFVDVAGLRLVRDVPMPIAAVGVGWVAHDRVVALLQKGGVVLVDARDGSIVGRRRLSYAPPCAGRRQATTPSRVVFVVATGRGVIRLVRIDASGDVTRVSLPRLRAQSSARTCSAPGFAVDPSGGRALVAAVQGPLAEVDLADMSVRYRHVRGLPRGLRRRTRCPRGWCIGRRSRMAGRWHRGDRGIEPREGCGGGPDRHGVLVGASRRPPSRRRPGDQSGHRAVVRRRDGRASDAQ